MQDFVERAYAAGLKGHIDALAFHPYPGPQAPGGPLVDLGAGSLFANGFDAIRSVRDDTGDSETPIFVTETGISTVHGVTRAEQADATRRIYRKTVTMDDVIGVVFYRIVEPVSLLRTPTEIGLAWVRAGSGYPRPPWPVYCAFVLDAGSSYPGC